MKLTKFNEDQSIGSGITTMFIGGVLLICLAVREMQKYGRVAE
jgi:hypothetical protein